MIPVGDEYHFQFPEEKRAQVVAYLNERCLELEIRPDIQEAEGLLTVRVDRDSLKSESRKEDKEETLLRKLLVIGPEKVIIRSSYGDYECKPNKFSFLENSLIPTDDRYVLAGLSARPPQRRPVRRIIEERA